MKLIDRYINAVGKHLPRSKREDIQKEIRSLIEDMLEDRSQQAGTAPDEKLVAEVLQEMGAPSKVAASYHANPYLIGPKSYPSFMTILKIVLVVVTAAFLFGMGMSLVLEGSNGGSVLEGLVASIPDLFSGLVQAFGMMVIIFAILERTVPDFKVDFDEDWTPDDLPEAEEPVQVKPLENIFEIVFTIAALVMFNVYPHWIGAFTFNDGNLTSFVPLLSAEFLTTFLVILNVRWALGLGFSFTMLWQPHLEQYGKWARLALKVFDLGILWAFLNGPQMLGLNPAFLARHGMTLDDVPGIYTDMIIPIANNGLKLAFIVALIVGVIDLISKLVKTVRPQMVVLEK